MGLNSKRRVTAPGPKWALPKNLSMPVKVVVTNSVCQIHNLDDHSRKVIDLNTSYKIDGAEWSQLYRDKFWDGKEHLLRKHRAMNVWNIPTGLIGEIAPLLGEDIEWEDHRRALGDTCEMAWIGKPSRDYQLEAVEAVAQDRGPWATGRGLLALPIRSGKTHTAAKIIQTNGLRTLFTVPSDLLLYQTEKSFRENLDPCPVGLIGDGHWQPEWITIATVQSLLKHPEKAKRLLAEVDQLFVDEAHKLEGPAWRAQAMNCDARYKIGLSGSINISRMIPSAPSTIWLKACTGPILCRISMARLIEAGHLVAPQVLFYVINHPKGESYNWRKASTELIVRSQLRNRAIVDLAQDAVSRGLPTMVDTGRREQLVLLRDMLRARGVSTEVLHGSVPTSKRLRILDEFQAGEIHCLIGTVLGEGIDIPCLEVVINAEGQHSRTAAIQRLRNLTPHAGKRGAIFIDFADMKNKYLRKHSLARLQIYKSIRGFKVSVVSSTVDGRFTLPAA